SRGGLESRGLSKHGQPVLVVAQAIRLRREGRRGRYARCPRCRFGVTGEHDDAENAESEGNHEPRLRTPRQYAARSGAMVVERRCSWCGVSHGSPSLLEGELVLPEREVAAIEHF